MSEHVPDHIEYEPRPLTVEREPEPAERARNDREHHSESQERAEARLEELQHKAEQAARSSRDVTVETKPADHQPQYVNQELKSLAAARSLSRTRKKLSGPDRAFSHLIHQPFVEAVSNVTDKTVARPIELFTGALCALLGSSVALYMAKHYGFRYNLLLFFLLFLAGFAVGIVIDVVVSLLKRIRRHR